MDAAVRAFIEGSRRAILATTDDEGRPRLVPICFALAAHGLHDERAVLYSPLDEKPKRVADVRHLARVRDIEARPGVSLLLDRWSEDWTELGWVRIAGVATILEPVGATAGEVALAVALLRERYPQYRAQRLDDAPVIRVALGTMRTWGAIG